MRPTARPVNFGFVDGDIFLRTPVEGGLGAAPGSVVYFEVDRIDEITGDGWSVLVTGKTHLVDEPAELARLESRGIKPWPCGGPGQSADPDWVDRDLGVHPAPNRTSSPPLGHSRKENRHE